MSESDAPRAESAEPEPRSPVAAADGTAARADAPGKAPEPAGANEAAEVPAGAEASKPETPAIALLGVVCSASTADKELVARLGDALARPPASRLVHVHADAHHGRTVFTALGEPRAMLDAVVELGRRCAESIDLRRQHGPHPRVGVLDVVSLAALEPRLPEGDLAPVVQALAERLAREAGLASVTFGTADALADLRAGGLATLSARVDKGEIPALRPEHDSRDRRARSGFACVGARAPVITLHVELATGEVGHARRIAQRMQEGERSLPALRAMGFRLSQDRSQVAVELLDHRTTGLVQAFEVLALFAEEAGVAVVRSEVVGCLPRDAWQDDTALRIKENDLSSGEPSRRIIETWMPGGSLAADPGLSPLPASADRTVSPGSDADGSRGVDVTTGAPGPAGAERWASQEPADPRLRVLDLPITQARAALQVLTAELGERAFRANQVLHAVYGRRVRSLGAMTDLPAAFREKLGERVRLGLLDLVEREEAADGTVKYLWRLADGSEIESVAIPSERRTTACVSSQVGCALKCNFCATGYLGLGRNLTAGEMVDQVLAMLEDGRQAQESLNVVFMGMGEPGYNLEAVLAAVRTMNDPEGLSIGARHVTISTAGVVPAIERLAKEPLQLRLAVSLHAGDQALRESLMNVAAKYPLDQLLSACQVYQDATGRNVTFEYVVIPGTNDGSVHARQLGDYASQVGSKVNLIPYNPVEGFDAPAATERELERFRDELTRHYRGEVMVRQTRGRDIEAACGMLHRSRHAGRA